MRPHDGPTEQCPKGERTHPHRREGEVHGEGDEPRGHDGAQGDVPGKGDEHDEYPKVHQRQGPEIPE